MDKMDKKPDPRPMLPARLRRPPAKPEEPLVRQRSREIGLRPLWQLAPRVASYGMVAFIIWVILSVMFPPVFNRSSERAVVNSPVNLVTTPVEGVVTHQAVAVGGAFSAGQPLVTLQNSNLDRALLMELTGKRLDNQTRLEAARAKLASNQTLLASTTQEIQRYQSAAQREHAARIKGIEAKLAVARQQIDQQEDVVNRNQAMQWAGAVSQAYTDASRNQLTVLSGQRDAVQAELDSARAAAKRRAARST